MKFLGVILLVCVYSAESFLIFPWRYRVSVAKSYAPVAYAPVAYAPVKAAPVYVPPVQAPPVYVAPPQCEIFFII